MGFVIRWIFAFVLLAVTYNPTDWNYVRWSMANADTSLALVAFLGLVLFVGYIIYLRATLRSIGVFGIILTLAVVATLLWVLFDFEFISLDNPTVNTWIGILALSVVLAIGLSWSIVRRRLSGQADVDDIDE